MGEQPLELKGAIQRITYQSMDTGYMVARFLPHGKKEPITIVGTIIGLNTGEEVNVWGQWKNHPRYGRQFAVQGYEPLYPTTLEGIEKYLGSGLIKGIGPVMASRIVDEFKEETLDILDTDIYQLSKIEGIGDKRIQMIKEAWKDQKEIRNVMIFLQSHGMGPGNANRIFRQYGREAVAIIKENPYRMARDISGIGFLTADKVASKLGIEDDALIRLESGLHYVLEQKILEGHAYVPYEVLMEKAMELLKVDKEGLIDALGRLLEGRQVVVEDLNEDINAFKENNKGVYAVYLHVAETGIARHIKRLQRGPGVIRPVDETKMLEWLNSQLNIGLASQQIEALRKALTEKVLIITGGPGTGKTTIVHSILLVFQKLGMKVKLAAPTGRAAKRLQEISGLEAQTIHRLLEYSRKKNGFLRNEDSPLDCQLLVVDEASMMDLLLMYHLLKAIPDDTTLVLVGDVHQLPSVGPGHVLKDCISCGTIPVVRLQEIFRQAQESKIITSSHAINKGTMPDIKNNGHTQQDFYFLEKEDPGEAVQLIVQLVQQRIPKSFHFDPRRDIQVLVPMHRGIAGAENLNIELQKALNPKRAGMQHGLFTYCPGDKVMQIRNNYDKEVFNGDIGIIDSIDQENNEMTVLFDERPIVYAYIELDELTLAYAITVHKSQGSEYPCIVVPLLTQHYVLLQRNLIYTAVTRGKKLVIIVGSKKALAMAIKNNQTEERYTLLSHRLQ